MLKPRNLMLLLTALYAQGTLAGEAPDGYLVDGRGNVVTNSYDECVHTGSWSSEDAIAACEGDGVAKTQAETEPEPAGFTAVVPVMETVTERVTLDAATYFQFDEAELEPSARDRLDKMLAISDHDELVSINIVGHADPIGDPAYNRRLAGDRAESVRNYLVDEGGIPADRLRVASEGEPELVVKCPDKRGQALIDCLAPNRRVHLDVETTVTREVRR